VIYTEKGKFSMAANVLKIRGSEIVNGEGQVVTLRGFGLGGWMNMENFITGYPSHEEGQCEQSWVRINMNTSLIAC
jgi:hypothetical protein